MFHVKWIARILLAFMLSVQAVNGEARCCKLVPTSFGYVQVEHRDLPAATDVGNAVRRAARDVLGISNVRFLIVDRRHSRYRWGDTTPSGLPVYPWSFAHGIVDLRVNPPDYILPHEIGHDLFKRYLVPSTHVGQYGTDAPDWLDESVAVAFEAPDQKAERRCEASRLLKAGALIPVHQYLTMVHPDLASTPSSPGSDHPQKFNLATSVSQETPAFYAMSIAFSEYLVARTRSMSVLGELARAFRKGGSLEERILSRTSEGGRKFGPQELDRDFLAWLASDKRYQCHDGL